MAVTSGKITLTSGTGSKTVNLGAAYNWIDVFIGGAAGGDTFFRQSIGTYTSTSQTVISSTSTFSGEPTTGKIIQWRDSSNTIVFEGSCTGFSGNNVLFNITTQTGTVPPMYIRAGT